jgi:hypothetical protein
MSITLQSLAFALMVVQFPTGYRIVRECLGGERKKSTPSVECVENIQIVYHEESVPFAKSKYSTKRDLQRDKKNRMPLTMNCGVSPTF